MLTHRDVCLSSLLLGAALSGGPGNKWIEALRGLDVSHEPYELQSAIWLLLGSTEKTPDNISFACAKLGLNRNGSGHVLERVAKSVLYRNLHSQRQALERSLKMGVDSGLIAELRAIEDRLAALIGNT